MTYVRILQYNYWLTKYYKCESRVEKMDRQINLTKWDKNNNSNALFRRSDLFVA